MPDELPDLRPSPWTAHRWIIGGVSGIYLGYALAVLTDGHGSHLQQALQRLAVMVVGVGLGLFIALTSTMLAVCARRPRPLLTAYGASAAIVAAVIGLGILVRS